MVPSGLSNTNKGTNQNFGKNDRMTCPIPWWVDSLDGKRIVVGDGDGDGQGNNSKVRVKVKEDILNNVSQRIQQLRIQVSEALDRPTMSDASHAHECYYSKSSEGASLARHLDEFHEESKGPRGWLLPSRRSISWLIYLSDKDWDTKVNGGELRSFPQMNIQIKPNVLEVGVHDGNLQIGWLDDISSTSSSTCTHTRPVYLDSWFKPPTNENSQVSEPCCILYTVKDEKDNNRAVKEYISKPWINSMEMSLTDFLKVQSKSATFRHSNNNDDPPNNNIFISQDYAKGFKLIEDRETWVDGSSPPGSVLEDIAPIRGSIVMFDSVSLPHEVRVVKQGTRAAAAGWFHEQTQPIPEGFY